MARASTLRIVSSRLAVKLLSDINFPIEKTDSSFVFLNRSASSKN